MQTPFKHLRVVKIYLDISNSQDNLSAGIVGKASASQLGAQWYPLPSHPALDM